MILIIKVKIWDQTLLVEYLPKDVGEVVVTRLMGTGVMVMLQMDKAVLGPVHLVVVVEAQEVLLLLDQMENLCLKIMMVHKMGLDTVLMERMDRMDVLQVLVTVPVDMQLVMMVELLIMRVLLTSEVAED